MKTHCIDNFDNEFLKMICASATSLKLSMTQAVDECGDVAGAVHPARESGWIAWWPGDDPHNELAAFTRSQYRCGFASPYDVGDVLCTKSTDTTRFKVVDVTVERAANTWLWVIKLSQLKEK